MESFINRIMKIAGPVVGFLSAEAIVARRNTNGGTEIVVRTFWTAGWFFLILILARATLTHFQDGYPKCSLGAWASELIWLGEEHHGLFLGLVAGIYAALYTRYTSQWRYLADLYNMIMQAECTPNGLDPAKLAEWRASFIADAKTLHLLNKQIFKEATRDWYQNDPLVVAEISDWKPETIELLDKLFGPAAKTEPDSAAAEDSDKPPT